MVARSRPKWNGRLEMTLRTCTLGDITIGWANVAKYPSFRLWIESRMAAGYTYMIITDSVRTVAYNNATKINSGVGGTQINDVMRKMGVDFLTSGDISIVNLHGDWSYVRMAETAQDVLDHDTKEVGMPLASHCSVCGGERALSLIPLVIIEVQTGSYLGEDDIVRYEDDYNRHAEGATHGLVGK
jgi:hypothetical protein